MTRSVFTFTVLALALVATLSTGCNGNSSGGRLSAPSSTPPPAPAITSTYTITLVSGDGQSGPCYMTHSTLTNGQLLLPEPLVVEVRDSHGNLAPDDKVSVLFTCVPGPYGILGVEALGQTTTGSTTWLSFTPPGSGRAAVGAIPNYPGTWQVTAQVTPLQTSAGNVPASSNVVVFTVTGAP